MFHPHLLFMNHEERDRLALAEARDLDRRRVMHDAKLEARARARARAGAAATAAESEEAPARGGLRALARRLVGPIAVRVGLAD
jgi:hypothetical protein